LIVIEKEDLRERESIDNFLCIKSEDFDVRDDEKVPTALQGFNRAKKIGIS